MIIPPQYSIRNMLPATLFIADMMNFLNRDYYVGLFSASALHGAGHQQPMDFQVMIKKPPFRNIKNQKLNISFYTKTNWELNQINKIKTEAGYLKVSSPELTAFELVQYHKRIGGLNRIIPILEDLAEAMKPSLLSKTAKTQKIPNIQRLGYLLDELNYELLATSLLRLVADKARNIPLSLAHKVKSGLVNKKWSIIINTKLDQ